MNKLEINTRYMIVYFKYV